MTITPTDGTGITSCLSVRMSDACDYARKYLEWPDSIDSSKQFWLYKEDHNADLTSLFIGKYNRPAKNIISSYHHEWQWNWLDDVDYYMNLTLSKCICPVSVEVKDIADKYYHLTVDRMCVLYRGNDKAKEIEPANYQTMIDMAKASKASKFFVQTDDNDFLKFFVFHYPDTTFIDEIPRIGSNYDRYVIPETGKATFAQRFLASLYAMRWGNGLITTTGNTGIWAAFFRETLNNTYQHNGREKMWRKVG